MHRLLLIAIAALRIPDAVDRVLIRANDTVHGYGGTTTSVTLTVN